MVGDEIMKLDDKFFEDMENKRCEMICNEIEIEFDNMNREQLLDYIKHNHGYIYKLQSDFMRDENKYIIKIPNYDNPEMKEYIEDFISKYAIGIIDNILNDNKQYYHKNISEMLECIYYKRNNDLEKQYNEMEKEFINKYEKYLNIDDIELIQQYMKYKHDDFERFKKTIKNEEIDENKQQIIPIPIKR